MKPFIVSAATIIFFACMFFMIKDKLTPPHFNKSDPDVTEVEATIVSIDRYESIQTYVVDEHGHHYQFFGIWGKVGDHLPVYCREGVLCLK